VGDISQGGSVSLSVSGCVTSATKTDGYNSNNDSIVSINYANRGYTPQVFFSPIYNPISSSVTNDFPIFSI
jgi:hypothetical protein